MPVGALLLLLQGLPELFRCFNDMGKAMMDPPIWYRSLDTLVVGTSIDAIKAAAKETVGDHISEFSWTR